MNREYRVAIMGATGAVGATMMLLLQERNFPIASLKLLSSHRSAGNILEFREEPIVVEELTHQSFEDIDLKKNSIPDTFQGYLRKNGKIGTRNFIGLISTVNCSATVVKQISDKINNFLKEKSFKNIDGAVCLKHSSGCGMNTNGYGMEVFHRTIQGFKNHPNFSHVFVVGLGCECAQISLFQNQESSNVKYLNIQDEGGSKSIVNKCFKMICDVLPEANNINRTTLPVEKLSVALQCGGSDSYSGITANPALGYASDILVSLGGSSILSETPEIYGAEHLLKGRTNAKDLQNKIDKHILWWQNYTKINGGSLDNNPSPGNKKGGLTTILEKSLGAVRHVFHELVHEGGDGAAAIVSQVSPRSAAICKRITDSSGVFEKTEDGDSLFEMHDWQRCISIGLASEKVAKLAYEGYQDSTNTRNEKIAENIDEVLEDDGIGVLFISEDHRVQFPADIQVFYVSPPTQNEIKQAIEAYYKQPVDPTGDSPE